jgi:hypothetical protein
VDRDRRDRWSGAARGDPRGHGLPLISFSAIGHTKQKIAIYLLRYDMILHGVIVP